MHSQTADKVYVVGDILGFNGDDESSKSGNVVSKWMAMIMMMMMMMMMKSMMMLMMMMIMMMMMTKKNQLTRMPYSSVCPPLSVTKKSGSLLLSLYCSNMVTWICPKLLTVFLTT